MEVNTRSFHLAGIIPVSGQPLDFCMDWSDCLMPLAPNYTALEHSVVECAMAGCETIWIVCNDDISPLVRYRLGDYVVDPVSFRRFERHPSEARRQIPIFYVPVSSNEYDRRDCLGYCVLHGAKVAAKISSQISKWLSPNMFYVSFPYGVFDYNSIRQHRKEISKRENILFTHSGKSIGTNSYTSFTFGRRDLQVLMEDFVKKATAGSSGGKRLPSEKRYSGKNFNLDIVFESVIMEHTLNIELPWFYDIGSWREYCEFLSTPEAMSLKAPSKKILKRSEFNPIGVDMEEIENAKQL